MPVYATWLVVIEWAWEDVDEVTALVLRAPRVRG
jgi:hypothetical protein